MATLHNRIDSWFSGVAQLVCRFKYLTLLMMAILTLSLASQIPTITVDTRDEGFFYDDDPTLMAYNSFRDQFGQDDTFIIALHPDNGIDQQFLTRLYSLHHELEDKVPYLDEVTSLVNGRIVRARGDVLTVEDMMAAPPNDNAEVKRLLTLSKQYPLYEKLLIATDQSLVTILLRARATKEDKQDLLAGFESDAPDVAAKDKYLSNEESVEITNAIEKVLVRYENNGFAINLSGTPALIATLQKAIFHDMSVLVPLSILLIVLFLTLLFRRLSGLIYPLLVVLLSLVASVGAMALLGLPITLVTQIMPSFLLVVGVADSVHILTIFYRRYGQCTDKEQAIVEAVGFSGLPVLMTTMTTACGMFSFVWADVATVAQLGIIIPIGVMLALLYTLILLPALITVFPMKQASRRADSIPLFTDRIFATIARVTTRRPILTTLISTMIIFLALASAATVRFSHNALTWFPKDSEIRTSTALLDDVNGGTVMLEAVIDSGEKKGVQQPDFLKKLEKASKELPQLVVHDIKAAKVWSLADVIKETNRALHEDSDNYYTIPTSQQLIAQELILFESSGSDDLEDFSDASYQLGRLSLLAPFADAILYTEYVAQVREYLQELFPENSIVLTGKIPLFVQLIKNVITSMAKSYIFALAVITLLMIFLVGRVRLGLLSMVANVAPIIFVLGLMGMQKIPLDMSTMLIGSLVLGLVVDDTIHFLHHFRKNFEQYGEVEEAVRLTLQNAGRAMVITSCVLAGGFYIYMAGYLESNVRYGLLTGSAVLFALAADFFLMPALLSLVYGKKTQQE